MTWRRPVAGAAGGVFAAACLVGCAALSSSDSQDARLHAIIIAAAAERLANDPTETTRRTASGASRRWTPVTDAARAEAAQRAQAALDELKARIDPTDLTREGRLDYEIFASSLKYETLHERAMRDGTFLYGNVLEPSVDFPDVLIASHGIVTEADAQNFIERLKALPGVINDTLLSIEARHSSGVTMMKSAYKQVASRASAFAVGTPCGGKGENPLATAFRKKVEASGISPDEKSRLLAVADDTLNNSVCPAYKAYAARALALMEKGRDKGAWSLPNGDRFYRDAIELSLGERTDPKDIHAAGLAEMAHLQGEMRALMSEAGFEGDIREFNEFLRTAEAPSLPNTPEGRTQYVDMAERLIAQIYSRMPDYFNVVPQAKLVVEIPTSGPMGLAPSAGAFYTEAPVDGSRPAIYNLGVGGASHISIWALAATTYHEIAPGHHHQVETFRAAGGAGDYPRPFYPGYFDGWALYAEELAGEMGGYDNVYARIGWLQAQLMRAIRMVLDTGLNAERWTPEQAAAFQEENGAAAGSVNRYLIWPGQGLSYYWGYLEFKRLRRKAETELGERFDLKEFHARVLEVGPVPLSVLEFAVDQWIEEELSDSE